MGRRDADRDVISGKLRIWLSRAEFRVPRISKHLAVSVLGRQVVNVLIILFVNEVEQGN